MSPVRSVPGLVATMSVAMGVGPLLVFMLSTLSPFLVPSLGLTSTQFGALGAVTFAVAALSSPLGGKAVDRAGGRTVVWWLVLGAVGAMFIIAAAPGYKILLLGVATSGILQALSNPVTNHLAAQWVPASYRPLAIGIKQSGVQMTQALAGLVLPSLALLLGWRGAILLAAVSTLFLGMVLLARYVPRDEQRNNTVAENPTPVLPPAVWWVSVYAFLTGSAHQGITFHLPLFGYEELGLSVGTSGLLVAVMGGIAVASRIVWGRIYGRLGSCTTMLTVALGGAVGMTLVLLSGFFSSSLVWVAALVLGATGGAASVVVMVNVMDIAKSTSVGRASGVVSLGMFLGYTVGPVSVGFLVDFFGDYSSAWLALAAFYVFASASRLLQARTGGSRN